MENKKFYKVYRITSNESNTKLFAHYFQVRSYHDDRQCGKEVYFTEDVQEFSRLHRGYDEPPPIPKSN
jgi:hypothetical protein